MRLFIFTLLIVVCSLNINAKDRNEVNNIAFGYGSSGEHIEMYKISFQKDLNKYIFNKKGKYLPSYYETSIGYWDGENNDSVTAFSFSPVFRYQPTEFYDIEPYLEIGIGATYISKTKIINENFGIHFQFENIVGIGFRYKDFDLSYRYTHYSNAGLSRNNSGVDFNVITMSYRF